MIRWLAGSTDRLGSCQLELLFRGQLYLIVGLMLVASPLVPLGVCPCGWVAELWGRVGWDGVGCGGGLGVVGGYVGLGVRGVEWGCGCVLGEW